MQSRPLIAALAALSLFGTSSACPFHPIAREPVTLNNHRRSTPNECEKTAIQDVRVFNGRGFSEPKTICIDGGLIVEEEECRTGGTHINGTGKYLLPGLIDSHVHLSDVQSLENFTSYGITTALQMNCNNITQCGALKEQKGLASFIHAGMSAVGNGSLHEQQDPFRANNTLIYPDTNVTQFTEWQFNNGSQFTKIVAEPHGPSLQQQIEMVRVAHQQYGKQAMTHASLVMAYTEAVLSRTDGIQHVPDDGLIDNATIHKIKAQRQYVTPTLNIFNYAFTLEPELQKFLNITPGGNQTLQHAQTNAKNLYRAGVPILAGTDAIGLIPIPNVPIDIPFGLTLHDELQNLIDMVGMSPAEAINAATKVPAHWHRLHDRGVVEVGKNADLLLLNSNPLTNIKNTRDIDSIWAGGSKVSIVTKLVSA